MSIDILKLALEALEIGFDYAVEEKNKNAQAFKGYEHLAPPDYVEQMSDAITSLRQVIAEAEKQEPTERNFCERCGKRLSDGIHTCTPPAKQEQGEPVAVVDSTISGHIDWLCTFFPKQGTKLYTTPQPAQKPWVGLTRDEVQDLLDVVDHYNFPQDLIVYTQAKLKEKNT